MIGTDLALMHLHGISQKLKFQALKQKAGQCIARIADARGLSVEELADRLVPDLDLDPDGSKVLDFGPRQFRVGFDEQLRPFVLDSDGKRLADLPAPGKGDDRRKAEAASAAWKGLKKDARAVAQAQIPRLEKAMCDGRRIAASTFRTCFVEHPLVKHLARLLVWGAAPSGDPGARFEALFRVAEDGSLADARDNAYLLAPDSFVGVAHPLSLAAPDRERWSQVLLDYEILQPFEQLGRAVFAPTAEERKSFAVERPSGQKVPTAKLLGLQRRGWVLDFDDGSEVTCISKSLPGASDAAVLSFDPGIVAFDKLGEKEQTLGELQLPAYSAALDPLVFSELLRDVMTLAG
ncbi:MAG: DUF4132 domain-containing protein [Myxococcales bacterium]